ncbi:MAG: hypothetical protein J6Z01_09980 [Bacteroidales bacterium]|nr:hypothetical protein [Bacteroidales bacterium]
MKKLLYLIAILIVAISQQACGQMMDGVWTCKKVTIAGKNYDELSDDTKKMLDESIGATMTFKGNEVIDAQKKYGKMNMVKGYYHFSDDQKVLTVNFKKESINGGRTWENLIEGLPADFDYHIVTLNDKQLIFQFEQAEGIYYEYTYEKE